MARNTQASSCPQGWKGKNLTMLGLSRSGIAVARYVQKRGGHCLVSEVLPATPTNEPQRKELEALGATVEMGGHSKDVYTHSPLVVVSPGIPPSTQVISQLRLSGLEVISEVEFAWRENQQGRKTPMIGITGTNGKTTTTTLIAEILTAAGKYAPACGNIGIPVASILDESDERPADYWVAELSSFQLEFSPTLKANVGVFLNLTPDHIDWHGSMEAYQRAKLRLFTENQSPEWVVLNADDPVSQEIARNSRSRLFWFSRNQNHVDAYENKIYLDDSDNVIAHLSNAQPLTLFNTSELRIIGRHNHDNVLAAAAVALIEQVPVDVIHRTCTIFKGVEHRLELVTSIATNKGEVAVYNDSKATNTDAAISALNAFEKTPVVLIAGGRDKMTDLTDFTAAIKTHASHVVLIGEATQRFEDALHQAGFSQTRRASDLSDALNQALAVSNGHPVLFSPACASFDMFKDFEVRGRAFKEAVLALSPALTS